MGRKTASYIHNLNTALETTHQRNREFKAEKVELVKKHLEIVLLLTSNHRKQLEQTKNRINTLKRHCQRTPIPDPPGPQRRRRQNPHKWNNQRNRKWHRHNC